MSELQLIREVLDERKAENIRLLDLRRIPGIHDYVYVCDVNNPRLLWAVRDYLIEAMEKAGIPIHHLEGKRDSEWLLIDASSVCIHLFLRESREYYRLDELWRDKVIPS